MNMQAITQAVSKVIENNIIRNYSAPKMRNI